MSNLAASLKTISDAAIRHKDVMAIRKGDDEKDEDGDGVPDGVAPEPEVKTRADAKEWRKWAVERAKEYADTVHPRLQQKDGPPKPLPLMAKPNDVLEQVGIVPSLYLDFLKFCAGYCMLGMLLASVPSYILNPTNAWQAYDAQTLAGYPTFLLYLSLGARSWCTDSTCKTMNTLSAVCEAIFSILLLLGTYAFRARAARMAAVNDANNVFTREYAVQLHGMPKDVTPEEVKEHLEGVLVAKGGLPPEQVRVWDVALMTNCAAVLRQAVKQAPLERKWAILSTKLAKFKAFKAEKDTGWDINQKIGELRDLTFEAGQNLLAVRSKIEKKGFKTVGEVVGAFVTFEEQPAAQACLKLYGGGPFKYFLQKKELRFKGGQKLKAYPAAQPRDVMHENLPYRINALDARGMGTALRRLVSLSFLSAFILVSFGTIIAVNSSKNAAQQQLSTMSTLSPSVLALIDMAFPSIASVVVVGVNLSLQLLVGALGKFERHPTLSGMHKAKATTIFIAQTFNTGVVPLVVSMAPPPNAYAGAYAASCNCSGYFCCAVGPKGVIARGMHVTMTSDWHRDVGTILASSLLIQAVLALVLWAVPMVVFKLKRAALKGGVLHRYDMEALYEGPPIDLPKFIGKAYAFCFVMLMYAAVMPVLYAIGFVFFFASWVTQRFAFFRIHSSPPPYSFELIETTLWWLPWAVILHTGLAFWGYASLPSFTIDGSPWVRPYPNMKPYGSESLADLLLSGGSSANLTLITGLGGAGAASTTGAALDALSNVYSLPAHVNSLPTMILFAVAAVLLVLRLLLALRASPLYLPLAPVEVTLRKALKACARACQKRGSSVKPGGDDDADGGVVDPPFPRVLEGVERSNVRLLDGKVVLESQLGLTPPTSLKGRLLNIARRMTPSAIVFQCLGLYQQPEAVSEAEWKEAKPVFTRLRRAADISYQPEFHPTYERAYVYLAEPERLKAFTEANAPKTAPEGMFGPESESDDDEEEGETGEESDEGERAKKPAGGGAKKPEPKQAEQDLQEESISDGGVDL